MTPVRIPMKSAEEAILYKLFELSEVSSDHLSVKEIQARFPNVQLPLKQIEIACENLQEENFLTNIIIIGAGVQFQISNQGYQHVHDALTDPKSIFSRLKRQGEQIFLEPPFTNTDGNQLEPETTIPAANRYVTLDDNDPQVKEVKKSVSELIQAVGDERSNDFEDKEGRLAELAALDLLLAKPQTSVPLVEKILKDTVTYLSQRFANATIGQIALELLKRAAFLFGI